MHNALEMLLKEVRPHILHRMFIRLQVSHLHVSCVEHSIDELCARKQNVMKACRIESSYLWIYLLFM